MTGVEILATKEVVAATQFNSTMFWIIFGITLGVMFIIGVATSLQSRDWVQLPLFLFAGLIVGVLFGVMIGNLSATPAEYETQYKVTISDEVQMNDFLSRYEIISTEGRIYTVREIEND